MFRTTVVLVLFALKSFSQENEPRLINEMAVGALIEQGLPFYDLPENNRYYPLLAGSYFSMPFYKTSSFFNVGMDVFLHGGVALFKAKTSYEAGLNVRIKLNFAITSKDVMSLQIGSGPHYTNIKTTKQASGYIFSDNFLWSYRRWIGAWCLIDVQAGFRHISNAGIQEPNGGIDNVILSIGFQKMLGTLGSRRE